MRMRSECLIKCSPKVWDADIINPNPGYGNKYVNNVTSVEVDNFDNHIYYVFSNVSPKNISSKY